MFHEFNNNLMLTQLAVCVAHIINVLGSGDLILWRMKNVKYGSVKWGMESENSITWECGPADLRTQIWGSVRRSALKLELWISIGNSHFADQISKIFILENNIGLQTYGPRE